MSTQPAVALAYRFQRDHYNGSFANKTVVLLHPIVTLARPSVAALLATASRSFTLCGPEDTRVNDPC